MSSTIYKVCESDSAIELAREINQLLKVGWTVQGGVTIRSIVQDGDSSGSWYAQAVILEKK